MTERKPLGITFGSWVDQQIDEANKKGEFDDLPGKGKPLPGVDGHYAEDWWIKDKLQREKLDVTPETIVSRRRVEEWMETYLNLPSETAVKTQASQLNERIEAANKTDLGPLLPQALLDVDTLVAAWKSHQS